MIAFYTFLKEVKHKKVVNYCRDICLMHKIKDERLRPHPLGDIGKVDDNDKCMSIDG